MPIDFTTFQEMEFPRHRDIVYILFYIRNEGAESLPFYVGESSRHVGRIGDYVSANFTAATDFKVGEAVKYLRDKGLRVVIKFKESHNRKDEETSILQELRRQFRLLNDLKGYSYKSADKNEQRKIIQEFIDQLLENPFSENPTAQTAKMEPSEMNTTRLTIPQQVKIICQELDAEYGVNTKPEDRVITRQNILRLARKRGINESSVLPADYCDKDQPWKKGKPYAYANEFLHSVPGGYILISNQNQ